MNKDFLSISMPEGAGYIIQTLEKAGYEAYIVGGCVRDACLNKVPNDWDLTTNASPQEIKALFRRTVDTGIEHGTVTVMLKDEGYEVTTYRIDGDYSDGRHPNQVTFTASLAEDLRRRDFTINAMAYNEREGLVDLFGGIDDLKAGMIRCVGDARERFGEDALRILRAVRFSAQLGFAIEEKTAEAAKELSSNLEKISAERIFAELMKILLSPHPDWLKKACELNITGVILPEFDAMMKTPQNGPHHNVSVGEHTLLSLTKVRADAVLRLAMLLHDAGKAFCGEKDAGGIWHFPDHAKLSAALSEKVLKRLKSDRATMRRVKELVAAHSLMPKESPAAVRRMASTLGAECFSQYLEVKEADILAQKKESQEEKLRSLYAVRAIWAKICADQDPLTVKDLAVTGKDLMGAGMKSGAFLGQVLKELLELVLEDPSLNQKDILMERAAALVESTQGNLA